MTGYMESDSNMGASLQEQVGLCFSFEGATTIARERYDDSYLWGYGNHPYKAQSAPWEGYAAGYITISDNEGMDEVIGSYIRHNECIPAV